MEYAYIKNNSGEWIQNPLFTDAESITCKAEGNEIYQNLLESPYGNIIKECVNNSTIYLQCYYVWEIYEEDGDDEQDINELSKNFIERILNWIIDCHADFLSIGFGYRNQEKKYSLVDFDICTLYLKNEDNVTIEFP